MAQVTIIEAQGGLLRGQKYKVYMKHANNLDVIDHFNFGRVVVVNFKNTKEYISNAQDPTETPS